MNISSPEKAQNALKKAKKVLIITEAQSSADSICAAIALHSFCHQHQTTSHAIVPSGILKRIKFLQKDFSFQSSLRENQNLLISIPTKDGKAKEVNYIIKEDHIVITVVPESGFFNTNDIIIQKSSEDYDLIISLNIDSLTEIQNHFETGQPNLKKIPIININNNLGNEEYGHINIGHPNKASLCEIVYDIIKTEKDISPETATVLLTGITASTESFLGKRVTSESFLKASHLQSLGAAHSDIIENLFKKKSLQTLKIWGRIMGNCQYDPKHKIAWSSVSQADLEITGASPEDIEDIAEGILSRIENTEIALLFFEDREDTFLQIRTEKQNIEFPDWKQVFPEAKYKKHPKGIDILFSEQRPSEAEFNVLSVIGKMQKTRLNLPKELKLKSLQVAVPRSGSEHRENFSPDNLPFSAPEKGEIKKPEKSQIPIWLEKR